LFVAINFRWIPSVSSTSNPVKQDLASSQRQRLLPARLTPASTAAEPVMMFELTGRWGIRTATLMIASARKLMWYFRKRLAAGVFY
jgi:hypothetical protein